MKIEKFTLSVLLLLISMNISSQDVIEKKCISLSGKSIYEIALLPIKDSMGEIRLQFNGEDNLYSAKVLIINANPDKKKEIKLTPEMLNLLGCSKDNFKKIIKKMKYKTFEKGNEIYFQYNPVKERIKKDFKKLNSKDNPFRVLKNLNLN